MFFTYDYNMVDGTLVFPEYTFPDKPEGPPVTDDLYSQANAIGTVSIGGSVEGQ